MSPKGVKNNPKGKGGFQERPQDINMTGRWSSKDSISFQYHLLLHFSVSEFKKWMIKYPEKDRTMAQELAYQAVLKGRTDIKYLIEITDRTEGKAPQTIVNEGEIKATFDDKQVERIAERIAGRKR